MKSRTNCLDARTSSRISPNNKKFSELLANYFAVLMYDIKKAVQVQGAPSPPMFIKNNLESLWFDLGKSNSLSFRVSLTFR